MVVDDLHVVRVAVAPAKADSPLVVDPDAVLTSAFASKRLQAISRWGAQVVELPRAVQKEQLAAGDSFERTKPAHIEIMKQLLRVL